MDFLERRVTGYKKQQRGQGCEDATYVKNIGDAVIMACADGHGDSRCKYASRGAEIAARVIVSVLEKKHREADDLCDFGELLNDSRNEIAERVVTSWVGGVLDDYRLNFPDDTVFAEKYEELRGYSERIFATRDGSMTVREMREISEYRHRCEEAIYKITLLYGTTVNAAVICNKFVFAIGIGDGDVVAVNGRRVEWLLPRFERYSTVTSSLSHRFDLVRESFSAILVPVSAGRRINESRFLPELVMISTDGLRNAFLSDEEFADKLLDIADVLKRGEGYTFLRKSMTWIEERTKYGVTQDDISFCIATKHPLAKGKKRKSEKRLKKC